MLGKLIDGCLQLFDEELARHDYEMTLQSNGVTDDNVMHLYSKVDLSEDEQKLLAKRHQIDVEYNAKLDAYADYKPIQYDALPANVAETDDIAPEYEELEDRIVRHWQIIKNMPGKIAEAINKYKDELASTDYQVTKAYEAMLMGEATEDIKPVIERRRILRDKINELEALQS